MTASRLDRSVMVFVLCVGVLLLLLQVASSPTGQRIPPSIIALTIVAGVCATTIATLRSHAAGWGKPIVKVIGALFALMAVWLIFDSPPDYRTALLDIGIGAVLLGSSFRRTTPVAWSTSDDRTG